MLDDLQLSDIIETIMDTKSEEITYMDAIVDYIESNNLEIDVMASIIKRSQVLKELLREESETLHLLEKTHRLQFE